jgi:hypothetical protein
VSTTEELLDRKVEAPVWKIENTAAGIRHTDHVAPLYPQKLAITSPTSGGRSVGIVRLRTPTMESNNGQLSMKLGSNTARLEEAYTLNPVNLSLSLIN